MAIGCLVVSGILFSQTASSQATADRIDSILSKTNQGPQLADVIMSLAQSDRQPSRDTVLAFTNELTSALAGQQLKMPSAWLLPAVREILSASGTNVAKATLFRNSLANIGIDFGTAQRVTTRFIKIGEEVRGPDDYFAR